MSDTTPTTTDETTTPTATPMTAKEISEAWLAFVNDTFMIETGCSRLDVEEEIKRLEGRNQLELLRERHRFATDMFITELLDCTPEKRSEMFSMTDCGSLALIQDRIQCGTRLLIGFVQQGVKIRIEGEEELEEYFKQLILQKPV